MSFFGKLKQKLFKSSSKLEEGIDAIVQDGGVEAPSEAPQPQASETLRPAPTVSDTPVTPEPETTTPAEKDAAPIDGPVSKPEPVVPQTDPIAPKAGPAPEPVAPGPETPARPAPTQPARPSPPPVAKAEPPRPAPVPPPPVTRADPQPKPVAQPRPVAPTPMARPTPEPEPQPPAAAKQGVLGRLFGRAAPEPKVVVRRVLDDDMLEQLEELLIASDMGVDTAVRVTANIAEGHFGRRLSTEEIKQLLSAEISRIMEPVARPMPIYPKRPQVILVVGVNGSGKTTTIGKLASQFQKAGKRVVIAAGDTFRAAAVEQLQVWGQRAGVPVLTAPEGSDPASLAFDALTKAQKDGADLLMIDTAGRLQNRTDLMEELSKIVRVIRKVDPEAPHNTLLVLDATTGQNAVNQVEIFQKLADVSGLVMTKLDGTAKGGILVSLADKFGLPIHAIGVGEQIDDLDAFDPEEFAAALTGLNTSEDLR